MLLFGVVINIVVAYLFYFELDVLNRSEVTFLKHLHYVFVYTSIFCFALIVPTFVVSVSINPGYLEQKFEFTQMVEEFIKYERDLMNLCTYCRLIKSETSFHCLMCNRCVELFDHHCPYINNCLGLNNYKYFLLFILSYFVFLISVSFEIVRNEIDTVRTDPGTKELWYDSASTLLLVILIGLCFPIITY